MKYVISSVIVTVFFFSCSPREYYAIDASNHFEFVLQTTNYALNDNIESKLERMKNNGNVLNFDRHDSENITHFKIHFAHKDFIKLRSLLIYSEPITDSQFIHAKAYMKTKPEFLLYSEFNGNKDTVYYKAGRHEYVNKFQARDGKFLGYRFYPN